MVVDFSYDLLDTGLGMLYVAVGEVVTGDVVVPGAGVAIGRDW